MSIESVMPSNHLILYRPLLLLPSIFPSIRVFFNELFLCIRWPIYWILASASVLPMNIQDWFPLGPTSLISLQSRDSQESSPAPQLETINSWALSLLYGPTLTSVHNYWKNHSFDYTDLCCKVMSLFFNMLSRFVITFLVAWPLANFLVKFIFPLTFIGLGLHCLIPWS